jgi:hypothetical protein
VDQGSPVHAEVLFTEPADDPPPTPAAIMGLPRLSNSILGWVSTACNNIPPLNRRQSYMHRSVWGNRGAKSLIALS